MTQVSNKEYTLFERRIVGREGTTLANLGNDHEFISKESIGMRPFGETKNKAMRVYPQNGQYHTIMEVFKFMRNEEWYEPDLNLYHVMLQMMGKNKMIEMAEEVFHELKRDGLEPDTRAFNEMMGAYLQVDMVERAVETYELMKASGCTPDKLTFKILIKNLEKFREEFAAVVKKECDEFLDSPEKFLREVEQKLMKLQIL